MDGKSFAKLCKDNKITGKNFTLIDVDIIFAKVSKAGLTEPPLLKMCRGANDCSQRLPTHTPATISIPTLAPIHTRANHSPEEPHQINYTLGLVQ
jgi:hypothetical protein